MQVPKELDPNEIRIVIWNGCQQEPEFGSAVLPGIMVRIVEYDNNGFIDEEPDTDHEGKECYVREYENVPAAQRPLSP